MAKQCMTCKVSSLHEKKLLENYLSDFDGAVFSSVVHRPNSKFHTVVMNKRHTESLKTITSQEWADILPVLKDGINKIESRYKRKNKPVR